MRAFLPLLTQCAKDNAELIKSIEKEIRSAFRAARFCIEDGRDDLPPDIAAEICGAIKATKPRLPTAIKPWAEGYRASLTLPSSDVD